MSTPPPPPPTHWDQRQARQDWENLSPACRRVLLGERPRGVSKALRLLTKRGLVVGFLPTTRGAEARQWGMTQGDLGWASWPTREPGVDARWNIHWLGLDYARWKAVLRAGAGLPPLDTKVPEMWAGDDGPSPLAKECLAEPVRICRTLSDACIQYLLHSTSLRGGEGNDLWPIPWAIRGAGRRIHPTLVAAGVVEDCDSLSYYTSLGRATVAVWRGPRNFEREEQHD